MMTVRFNDVDLILPNPILGNSRASQSKITVKRMMDSSIHTYINKKTNETKRFSFILTRRKALEVIRFFQLYTGEKLSITDHNNQSYLAYLTINPIELEMQRRAIHCDSVEEVDLQLVFEQL